jgi:CRISPR-associated endonuclease/helicase Cas3
VFRWAGDDDRSIWIAPAEIRPGDTIIAPAGYGGVDEYGWNPKATPAKDVADAAAMPFAEQRFVVRVAPGLLKSHSDEPRLAQVIESVGSRQWQALRDGVQAVGLPDPVAANLGKLNLAKRGKRKSAVEVYTDVYGDKDDCPRGVVFVAPFGIENDQIQSGEEGGSPNATEDDFAGSLPGFTLTLERHSAEVERMAEQFAKAAGVSGDRILDLTLAGHLHDCGKADPRFQAWLAYGDPLGLDADCPDEVLAKSARPIPPNARANSGLPQKWRHEALSVRLAPLTSRFAEAKDPELLLWLIGTHHGHGRPFFPHADPEDARTRSDLPIVLGIPRTLLPGPGPQTLAYDWKGSDWPGLYERLKSRYGVWELARMEAILRLADHRASERAGCTPEAKEEGVE